MVVEVSNASITVSTVLGLHAHVSRANGADARVELVGEVLPTHTGFSFLVNYGISRVEESSYAAE